MVKLFKKRTQYDKPNILQHLFPFYIKNYVPDFLFLMKRDWIVEENPLCDFILDDIENNWLENSPSFKWINNWLENNSIKPIYEANLRIPYSYINTNLTIQPVKHIEYIKFDFIIDNGGYINCTQQT